MPEKILSINPATLEVVGETEADSPEKIKECVNNARDAFFTWSTFSIDDRINQVKKLIPIIKRDKREIAELITKEMGKPISMSINEPFDAIDDINYYSEHIKEFLKEEIIFEDDKEKDIIVYEPLGVVAVITPWNYPLSTVFTCLIPALLCGNSVILKPSEHTLLTGKKIGKLFKEIETNEFPKNVFNLILGGKETGRELVKQDIEMVAFTGSVRAGKEIIKDSANKVHKLLLEMGGKDAAIVLKDADINFAAKSIVWNSCRNTGQVCCAIERVYVAEQIYDKFVDAAIKEIKLLKIGNPMIPETQIGPFAAKFQEEICISHINNAIKNGALIKYGGKKLKDGYFFEPTIITNVNHNMEIMKEETFAPVIPIMKFRSVDEAIKLANDSEFGLTGSVWTKDLKKGVEIAKKLQVGTASVNAHGSGKQGSAWGGAKSSGIGRLGTKEGTHEFTNIKTLRIKKIKKIE